MITKKLIIFNYILLISVSLYSQQRPQLSTQGLKPKEISTLKNARPNSSPLTRLLINDYENLIKLKKNIENQFVSFFNIIKGTYGYIVSGIIKVSNNLDEHKLVLS
jgi:hypothetical protein